MIVWEYWDGIKEDGSLWSVDMNLFNYYVYGVIGEWLYCYVVGICFGENFLGFCVVYIELQFGLGLDWVEVSFNMMYGCVGLSWYCWEYNEMEVYVIIFVNVMGIVVLLGVSFQIVMEGGFFLYKVFYFQGV